jgi:hypothetical protein
MSMRTGKKNLSTVIVFLIMVQQQPALQNAILLSLLTSFHLAVGLERNTPISIYLSTEFVFEDNITEVAWLWEELSGDPGVVALPKEFVSKNGLPQAIGFPWDTDKGVYLLQGFHNLHCLVVIYPQRNG